MDQKKIVVASNTFFSVKNFRQELIQDLLAQNYRVIVACEAARDGSLLKDVEIVEIRYPKSLLQIFTMASYLVTVARLIRRERPDTILSFTAIPNMTFGVVKAFFSFKLICNVTGFGRLHSEKSVVYSTLSKLYFWQLNKADIVFAQNKSDAELLEAKLAVPVKELPGSGVDLNQFQFKKIGLDRKRILFLGRLIKDKGAINLLEIAKRFPSLSFRFVGFPSLSDQSVVDQVKEAASVFENIDFLPGTENVVEEISKATFVCLPSTYREGTPKSLIEALAIGRGVIATDYPGTGNCVEHKKNGFLLNADSLDSSLYEAMKWIEELSQEDLEFFSSRSRKMAKSFDVNIVLENYREALKQ